jgi:hypothetical protein
MGARLDVGINALLWGTGGDEAFSPWTAGPTMKEDADALRKELQALGSSRLELLGIEFELVLQNRDGQTIEVRTVLYPVADRVGVIEFLVRESTTVHGHAVADASPAVKQLLPAARAHGGRAPSGPPGSPDRSTPEATWKTLIAAVAARDLDTYAACFAERSREREGAVGQLRTNPSMWEELDGLLRGPQEFTADIHGTNARCGVAAPEADGGGIGGLHMERIGQEWLITSW